MGVRITANNEIDKAKDSIQEAIEHLSEVVIARCYGTDELRGDYLNRLRRLIVKLLEVRDSML